MTEQKVIKSYKPIDPEYFNKYYRSKLAIKEECPICFELVSKSKMKQHQLTSKCINCSDMTGKIRCEICNKLIAETRIKQHLKSNYCKRFSNNLN